MTYNKYSKEELQKRKIRNLAIAVMLLLLLGQIPKSAKSIASWCFDPELNLYSWAAWECWITAIVFDLCIPLFIMIKNGRASKILLIVVGLIYGTFLHDFGNMEYFALNFKSAMFWILGFIFPYLLHEVGNVWVDEKKKKGKVKLTDDPVLHYKQEAWKNIKEYTRLKVSNFKEKKVEVTVMKNEESLRLRPKVEEVVVDGVGGVNY